MLQISPAPEPSARSIRPLAMLATAAAMAMTCACVALETGAEGTTEPSQAGAGKADDPHAAAPEPVAFRMTQLLVRDPHFYVRPLLTCRDLTDEGAFGKPSINDLFNQDIQQDDPDDPDGMLDLSLLLVFRPFDPTVDEGRVDVAVGECSAPIESTECDVDPKIEPSPTFFVNAPDGPCLPPDDDQLSTESYQPRPTAVAGPCFATEPRDAVLRLGLVSLPLLHVEIAAQYVESGLANGSLRGFLREVDADAAFLPESLPRVGGQPISFLFPGGDDNCAEHDDRDVHDGELGWWIYVDFQAEQVDYLGS